jgi:hypothetical protein
MDEARIDTVKVSEIKSETGKTSRRFRLNEKVCASGKCFELLLVFWRIEIKVHTMFPAIVPPIQEATVLAGLTAHCRSRRAVANSYHICSSFGQQFGGEAAGVIGEV